MLRIAIIMLIPFSSFGLNMTPTFFSIDEHTVALWRFDEGGGRIAVDHSDNGNTGTIVGCTWTKGLYGNALQFNGIDNYVSVPHSSTIVSPTSAITVEALVWVNAYNSLSEWSHILDKPHTYALSFNNGTPAFAACGVGYDCWWTPRSYRAPTGKWMHLAAQFDGKKRQLYINDSLIAETPASGSIAHMSGYPLSDLVIGAGNLINLRSGSSGYFFNGIIDEVRISKIARYPQCGDAFQTDAHTVALWRFNENDGAIAYDASGNNNHASIHGAVASRGKCSGALLFDGIDDFAAAPHSPSLVSPKRMITIEAVVMAQGFNTNWSHIIDKPHTYALSFNSSGHSALALCGTSQGCWWTPAVPVADLERWMVVAGQYDRTKMQLFIDGQLIAEERNSGTIAHLDQYAVSEIVIGAGNLPALRNGYDGYFFKGLIDEIRVSDTVRYKVNNTGTLKRKSERFCQRSQAPLALGMDGRILYYLAADGFVNIALCDIRGRFVITLFNQFESKGFHTVRYDRSSGMPRSGCYFVRMKTVKEEHVIKLSALNR